MAAVIMNLTTPGVYIQEIDSVRPIGGVSTGVCGFVGISAKGDPAYDNVPTLITSWNEFYDTYGGFVFGRFLAFAVYQFFTQGGTTCYIVQVPAPAGTTAATATIKPLNLTATATSIGSWANKLTLQVSNSPASVDPSTTTANFSLSVVYSIPVTTAAAKKPVYDFWSQLLLQQININAIQPVVITDKTGKIIANNYTLESYVGLSPGNLTDIQNRINNSSFYIRVAATDPTATPGPRANASYPLVKGTDGSFIFSGPAQGTTPAQGIDAFSSLEDNVINMIASPDLVSLPLDNQLAEINNAVNYADGRTLTPPRAGSLFFIADAPLGLNVQDIISFKEGAPTSFGNTGGNALNNSFAALYYPWYAILDSGSQNNVLLPPSGAMAGTYANTDANRGVFKAPAGIDDGKLITAVGIERSVTASDQSVLNPQGINAIRNLPNFGIVVWGARTLALDPAWQYINVRRTMVYLEQSVKGGTWWAVFEPNTPALWGKISRNTSAFLKQFWQSGGLLGQTAEEAFYVKVDSTNNPPEQMEMGYLVVEIGVSIVRPAEFVVLQFTQMTQAQ
jgi:uncharacterized protein